MKLSPMRLRNRKRAIALAAITAGLGLAPLAITAPAGAAPKAKAKATMITTRVGPFGTMLVVGNGNFAGYTVYEITSDQPGNFGCTPAIIKTLPGEGRRVVYWAVHRQESGVACSHDQQGPYRRSWGKPEPPRHGNPGRDRGTGDLRRAPALPLRPGPRPGDRRRLDEPTLPPWHGLWWLVGPTGRYLAWPETLTTTTVDGKSVLAALMFTGIGWEQFPVYSYSKDTGSTSNCTGACAVGWPPVLSNGTPAVEGGASSGSVTTIMRADGTDQLAYTGKPLYLFGFEGIAPQGVGYVATGSGDGAKVGGGVFSFVTP